MTDGWRVKSAGTQIQKNEGRQHNAWDGSGTALAFAVVVLRLMFPAVLSLATRQFESLSCCTIGGNTRISRAKEVRAPSL